VQAAQSEIFVEQTFSGSLPGFLVAFLGGKTISDEEAEELRRLIDEHREG
jgi:predicted transcriptional regulator